MTSPSGGRTDVRRHQESVRHARLGSTKVQYVAHGQNVVDGVTNMLYIFLKTDLLKFVGIPYSLGYTSTRSANFLACFLRYFH